MRYVTGEKFLIEVEVSQDGIDNDGDVMVYVPRLDDNIWVPAVELYPVPPSSPSHDDTALRDELAMRLYVDLMTHSIDEADGSSWAPGCFRVADIFIAAKRRHDGGDDVPQDGERRIRARRRLLHCLV